MEVGPDDEHQQGRLLGGRYRLGRVLGQGGMGTVWSGQDEMLGREVAIKEVVPPPQLSGAEIDDLRRRILQEARAAARITSPAAVTVYDVVEEDGHPWIVMELLAPRTLDDVLAERRLGPEESATVGLRVLAALQAAGAAGVLHRDVKPGNVMFRGDGDDMSQAVLTDFGIARFVGDPSATTTGTVVGSPAYVAPERARGEPATLASDLWSLGITLWTAVEGASPFQRDGALPTLTAIVTEDVPAAVHAGELRPVLEADPAQGPPGAPLGASAGTRAESGGVRARRPGRVRPGVHRRAGRRRRGARTPAPAALDRAVPCPSGAHPVPSPVHRPSPSTAPPRTSRRRIGVVLVVAAVLAAVLAFALVQAVRDQRDAGALDDPSGAEQTEPGAGTETDGSASAAPTPSDEAPAPSPSASETEGPVVPEGFRLHQDDTGFSVAVPQAWEASPSDSGIRFRDPDSAASLLIAQTDEPKDDPVGDWQDQERSVSQRLADYALVGEISGAELRGWQTADWEFTYSSDDVALHALNRNLITTPGEQAYALLWTVPEDRWEESEDDFQVVFDSFQPRP